MARDNFSANTKKTLAERVAWRCSFPSCGKLTTGPKQGDEHKSLNLGDAAHIIAASPNGPRFDEKTTPEERKSILNGIWMCKHHARLIDIDSNEFTAETLKIWKREAEEKTYKELKIPESFSCRNSSTLIAIGYENIFYAKWSGVEENTWIFSITDFIEGDIKSLKAYADNFNCLSKNQKFISVSSQGDARVIEKPIDILYLLDGSQQLRVKVCSRVPTTPPDQVGSDLMIGGNGDIFFNGDLKLAHGIDAAIQKISTTAGLAFGEIPYSKNSGSFISSFYKKYKTNISLLSDLIKLELIRLSLIPAYDANMENSNPPLGFIKEFRGVSVIQDVDKHSRIHLRLDIVLGDNQPWYGDISVFVSTS